MWASEKFELTGDLVRFTGRGIKDAEYCTSMAAALPPAIREKIFKAMRAVVLKLWAEGSLRVEELHRRMAEMKQDAALLALDHLPMAELLDVIQRTSEHMRWFAKNDPNPERRARQAAQLTEWERRMAVLLDRIGRPKGVLRRRKKLA